MKRIFSICFLLCLFASLFTGCIELDSPPEIKKGEFNFSVTYEYNGQTQTVSGVYVCVYNGNGWVLDGGFYRDWKGYIKGGEIEDIIELGTAEDGSVLHLHLGLYPEYFMGDTEGSWEEPAAPELSATIYSEEGISFLSDAESIEETYGAKIISYEYDQPIENSFG